MTWDSTKENVNGIIRDDDIVTLLYAEDYNDFVTNYKTHRDNVSNPHSVTATQISDFDTEVSNNSDVSANTSKLSGIESGAEVNTVDSVNTQTGVVVLDADNIDDSSTTNKFVTATDITNLGNLSGTNTGDQDLSGLALKSNVLELDNTTSFTPDADYEPATKKYVDDNAGGSGTVTSVAVGGNDGIEIDSGSPITTNGTIELGINKTTLLTHINVEDGADVTDTTNVTSAGALMDSELTSLSGIKTLTVPDNTTISTFGASLIDDTTNSDARTTLNVDVAGTDNSTDVTLTGEDYLSITGQQITANAINIDNLSASGVPSSSNFLRGDNQWATPAGSGNVSTSGTPVDNDFAKFVSATDIEGRSYAEVKSDLAITASDISDFDTEVSNNTDVAANTSARHDAITVTDSSEIDFTLVGQDITATLIAGSVDETKLDTSVNASLDLADSSLQSGDIGVTVQGYDADTAKYDDVTANFTGTLQNGGSNVIVDTDIDSTVQSVLSEGAFVDGDKTKLDTIETSADITDETNVVSALSGATLTDIGTPASGDKILIQDADNADNLKYAAFSEFGGGGIGGSTGSVDNVLLRADGTGGSTLQDGGIILTDTNQITPITVATGNSDDLIITGGTSDDTNADGGDLILAGGINKGVGSLGGIIMKNNTDSTGSARWAFSSLTTERSFQFPDESGIVTLEDATQTLTNKTISDASNTLSIEGTTIKSTGEGGGTKYLREDGDGTCSWQTVAGGGDVSKVGTPVDNQIGVWTGDGTIEGTSSFTFDGSVLTTTVNLDVNGEFFTNGTTGVSSFGTNSPTLLTGSERVQFEDATGSQSDWSFRVAGAGYSALNFAASNGTLASPTASINNNNLGRIDFYGYDGTNYINAASIKAAIDGTPDTNDMPGRLSFYTTPDGSATMVEAMGILNDKSLIMFGELGATSTRVSKGWFTDLEVTNDIVGDITGNAATATAAASQVITDNAILTVDDADAADNDYAKFTANGIEGRSFVEVKTDLSLDSVENTALSTWDGNANITTVGTIGTGTWQGTAITDTYLANIDLASGSLTLSGADALTLTTTASTNVTLPTTGTLLANVSEDTTPTLGGELVAADNNISGMGSASFTQELDNGSKTASFSVDFSTDQKQKVTLTANTMTITLDTTDIGVGNYLLKIVNGGLATITWAGETGSVLWPGGTAPTLTSSGTDIVTFYFDGTNFYGVSNLDFS